MILKEDSEERWMKILLCM